MIGPADQSEEEEERKETLRARTQKEKEKGRADRRQMAAREGGQERSKPRVEYPDRSVESSQTSIFVTVRS